MKDLRLYLLAAPIIGGMLSLSSCVNTETVEPEITGNDTRHIVLNLSAPEDVSTRASSDYKLRYVAKLFNGSKSSLNSTLPHVRQELIEGEQGLAGVENQMVFEVPANNNYVVFVFADYIPQNSQRSEEGFYNDYYFDTKNYNTGVSMLATPGNSKTDNVALEFFNNDNYECFAASEEVGYKTEDRVDLNLKLKRIVAKVRFVDTSKIEGDYDIDLASTTYIREYDMIKEHGYTPITKTTKFSIASPMTFTTADEQELLYFYTFASNASDQTPALAFFLTDKSGSEPNTYKVEATKIPVESNKITTVKGKFVEGLFPSSEPDYDPTKGYIYLNLSLDGTDWVSQDSEWSSN